VAIARQPWLRHGCMSWGTLPDTARGAILRPMTDLTVRRLLVDLKPPIARHWNGGDAFRSAFFNALSMSFPAGEQFFIDAVRRGMKALPPEAQARFAGEVQGFIGQEATHRRIHGLFNEHLKRQGLVNHWEGRIVARSAKLEGVDPRNWVAVTAATEHWTAIFADYLLAHPQVLQGAEPRLRDLWLWHCAEESEHRSTAFDLYLALGGNTVWRKRIFRVVSWHFSVDLARQTLHNLWQDGTWWRPGTWSSAWTLLMGEHGLVRLGLGPWRRYLRDDFHPQQGDASAGQQWLAQNAALAPPVQGG
jgi:predicted metal-dependent hydrolase